MGPRIGAEPGEESVIVVAVRRPAHSATFEYRGCSFDLLLPPTYYNYSGVFGEVKADLEAFLGGRVPLRTAKVPLKAVATYTGLARYGRNNIAYAGCLGSYVQLMAFACPLPVDDARDQVSGDAAEQASLDECGKCRACQKACPAGAITGPGEHFVLHAERCLTWFSKYEGPLPDAFGAAERPCLVGCMVCQEVCPANRERLQVEALGVRFTQGETEFLLDGDAAAAQKDVPAEIRTKPEALRCGDFGLSSGKLDPVFRRNLGAVLRHRVSNYGAAAAPDSR